MVSAPLRNPRRILDVGCGTGIVTCHLGQNFPCAEVYGIDLSPVPLTHAPPANVMFCQGIMPDLANSEDDPRFVAGSFDFVFSRLLIMGMNKWQDYVTAAAKLLQPGGFVEFQELDTRFYIDGALCDEQWEWASIFHKEAAKRGMYIIYVLLHQYDLLHPVQSSKADFHKPAIIPSRKFKVTEAHFILRAGPGVWIPHGGM